MEELFLNVVNLSITASWVIAVVLLLRFLLRSVPRKYTCLLWLVVLFRLLCPISLEAEFSLVPPHTAIQPEIVYTTPQINTQSEVVNQIANATLNPVFEEYFAPTPQNSANPLQIYLFVASWLWALGIAALCGYTIFRWMQLRRQLREAVPDGEGVYLCNHIASPFVFGLLRPRIYLPYGLGDTERHYVLLHECSHIARWDFLLKPLFWLAVMLHWLNPLVWVAWHYFSRDLELACDERAIAQLDDSQKQSYSYTLVSLAAQQHRCSCPVAFGNHSTKQRIAHVLRYKKQALWITGVTLGIIVMATVALGVNQVQMNRLGDLRPELTERDIDYAYIQWGCMQIEVTDSAEVQALRQLLADTEVQLKAKLLPDQIDFYNGFVFGSDTDSDWAGMIVLNSDCSEMYCMRENNVNCLGVKHPQKLQETLARYGKTALERLADTTTYADLNHDGVDERIVVNPEQHLLAIYNADDTVLYRSEGLLEPDYNYYLYKQDGKDYLLVYMSAYNVDNKGGCLYQYTLGDFTRSGKINVVRQEEIRFGLCDGVGEAENKFDAQKVYEFLQKVDALAQDTTLLYYEDSWQNEQLYSMTNQRLGYDTKRHLSWLPDVPDKADADILERLEYMEYSLQYDLQKNQLQQWLKEQGKFNYRQHEFIHPVMLNINQREYVGFTLRNKENGDVLGKYAISAQNPQSIDDKQRGHLYYWFNQATEEWTLMEDTSIKLLQ